ncbi:MAG: hypothetical protein KDA54_21650 [Phycisphaerales bacterium]|nr:hypothetical protein [Phycisphaerales bacterium]
MVESRFAMRVFDSLVDCCAIIIALRDNRSSKRIAFLRRSDSPLGGEHIIVHAATCAIDSSVARNNALE